MGSNGSSFERETSPLLQQHINIFIYSNSGKILDFSPASPPSDKYHPQANDHGKYNENRMKVAASPVCSVIPEQQQQQGDWTSQSLLCIPCKHSSGFGTAALKGCRASREQKGHLCCSPSTFTPPFPWDNLSLAAWSGRTPSLPKSSTASCWSRDLQPPWSCSKGQQQLEMIKAQGVRPASCCQSPQPVPGSQRHLIPAQSHPHSPAPSDPQ